MCQANWAEDSKILKAAPIVWQKSNTISTVVSLFYKTEDVTTNNITLLYAALWEATGR